MRAGFKTLEPSPTKFLTAKYAKDAKRRRESTRKQDFEQKVRKKTKMKNPVKKGEDFYESMEKSEDWIFLELIFASLVYFAVPFLSGRFSRKLLLPDRIACEKFH
ncbi:MAG TPA: hypothetical protein VGO67_19535 [Verrucomicrobiae bacterium]